jgi:hypothetical protein
MIIYLYNIIKNLIITKTYNFVFKTTSYALISISEVVFFLLRIFSFKFEVNKNKIFILKCDKYFVYIKLTFISSKVLSSESS